MAREAWFSGETFRFLDHLARNNDREWFARHRDEYIENVRNPALRFIGEIGPRLERNLPGFVADPRPVGGSLFRIHRDVRFSRNKAPYKTHCGIQFRHRLGRDAHAPGLYLHLEPRRVFAAAGIWHPDGPTLGRLREAIADDCAGWRRALAGRAFARDFRLAGESLKRPPRGFDADHPLIEDLKRKDLFCVTELGEDLATSPELMNVFLRRMRAARPLLTFILEALEP